MSDPSSFSMANELLASEQRFRGTFEQAAVGMAHVALDGRWLLVNQKLCDIVGYTYDELLVRSFQDITHPDDLEADLSLVQQLLAKQIDTYTLEKRYVHKNGTIVWINLTVSVVHDVDDTPQYFISVIENIDLRKQVEAALRRNEQMYRTLVDAVQQIIWLSQPDGSVEFFNKHWYNYTGSAEGQDLGLNWLQIVHPDDRERVTQVRSTAIQNGKDYQVEVRFKQQDGSYCWHVAHVVPLRDDVANIIAWLGSATEIDARKKAEEAISFLAKASAVLGGSLNYEETLLSVARLATEHIADYCLVDLVDDNGHIQRVVGVHRDPSKSYLIEKSRGYAPLPGSESPIIRVLRTGEPEFVPQVTNDWIVRVAQNQDHVQHIEALGPQSVIMAPMMIREQSIGVLSLVTVNPHHQYDQTDLTFALDLASRAAQAVDNARLYQLAQTAIRERDAFVGIASHELKNALAALSGQAYMLQRRTQREGSLSERNERSLDIILDQSERLSAMLDALLDVSRIGSNQFAIERKPLDLNQLTAQVVSEAQAAMVENGRHTIVLHVSDQPLTVVGDSLRLGQVLRNLIGNAVKYSEWGGVVDVKVERRDQQACVIVRDQGIGIPAEALPHLFERFYRVNTSQTIKGLGVGLYVVHQIVTQHAGTVAVESTQGRGSTFIICLPLPSDADETAV